MWRLVKYKNLVSKLETTHFLNIIGRLVRKNINYGKIKKMRFKNGKVENFNIIFIDKRRVSVKCYGFL